MKRSSLVSLWGPQIFGLGLISVVLSVISLAQPLYMINLYDRVLSSQSIETLISITGITLFILLCYGGFDWARYLLQARMGTLIEEKIRPELLEATVRLAAIDADSVARQRLTKLDELKAFVTGDAFSALFDLVFVPVYFVALYLFHPFIFGVCLVLAMMTVAIAVISEWSLKGKMAAYWRLKVQLRDEEAQLVRNAADTVVLGRLRHRLAMFLRREANAERDMEGAQNAASQIKTVNKLVSMFIQTLVLAIACYLVLHKEASVGIMFAVNIVATRAMQPLFRITSSLRSLSRANDSWKDVSDGVAKYKKDERAEQPISRAELRLRSLTVVDRKEDRKTLENIHIDVDPGELVVVTGASGAGKSTLLRAVVGLIPDYVGSLELDGREMKHWRFDRQVAYVGYLPQELRFFGLSIAENIAGVEKPDIDDLIALCNEIGIHDDISALKDGYETKIDSISPQFSGGQLKLIGLARALWGGPKLLVLDEPTAGLDSEREQHVLNALLKRKNDGASLLVASHSNVLIHASTKLLWLKWGQTKSYGLRDSVLAKMGVRVAA